MRRRILVVDDEAGMRRVIERVLGETHEVVCAESADQALERLEALRPDLAILDIRMPGTDGFELMSAIQERQPDVDVILMTGSVTETDKKLIRAVRQKAFYFIQKPFDREVLQTLVDRCLELRTLAEENRRHTGQLERQLDQARVFQRSLLPEPRAEIGDLLLEARYVSCDELCGDLFDYAEGPEGVVAFVIADVSGHGASAAMLTGLVKSAFHASQRDGYAPDSVPRTLQASMQGLAPNRFVTLFCGRYDPRTGRLEYVNAGHPPGLLEVAGEVRRLGPSGPVVLPWLAGSWELRTEAFEGGQRLLLYTDGVTEAAGEDGEFGEERLCRALCSAAAGDCAVDTVLRAVETHRGRRKTSDDVTLLGLSRC